MSDNSVKTDTAVVYKDLKKEKVYSHLSRNDFIVIGAIEASDGVYYGTVLQIKDVKLSDKAYVAMNCLAPHAHTYGEPTVDTSRDDYHISVYTCSECGYCEKVKEDHIYLNGQCQICNKQAVSNEAGIYSSTEDIYIRKQPKSESPQISKNALIKAGTHLRISEVKVNEYGNYWGNVTVAGNKTYSGDNWVYMGKLGAEYEDSLSCTYTYLNAQIHSKTVQCGNCSFKSVTTESHHPDESGRCVECGRLIAQSGTYYTDSSDCPVYSNMTTSGFVQVPGATLPLAGTAVEVLNDPFLSDQSDVYCKCKVNSRIVWIRFEDLANHIHRGGGKAVELDDECHSLIESGNATLCVVCGCQLPEKRVSETKLCHHYVDGICQGDYSATAIASVRCQFELYKACVIELYNTMLDMECNHMFGVHEDNMVKNYLQYEIDRLGQVHLVNDFQEFVNATPYSEYLKMY